MSESRIELEIKAKAEIKKKKKRFFKYFFYLVVHFGLIVLIDAHSFPLLYRIVFYGWGILFLYVYFFIAIPYVVLSLKQIKKDMFG